MVDGCCNNVAKTIVLLANAAVAIVGAVIVGVALYANLSPDFHDAMKTLAAERGDDLAAQAEGYTDAVWAACVFGAVLLVVGGLGCCGACCDSKCLLGLYFIVMLLLAVAEAAVAISLFVQNGQIETAVKTAIDTSLKDNPAALAQVEKDLHCCGVSAALSANGTACALAAPTEPSCTAAISDLIDSSLSVLGAVCIAAVLVQAVAMAFTCCLYSAISKRKGYVEYA